MNSSATHDAESDTLCDLEQRVFIHEEIDRLPQKYRAPSCYDTSPKRSLGKRHLGKRHPFFKEKDTHFSRADAPPKLRHPFSQT
jgi:hypothetical protein